MANNKSSKKNKMVKLKLNFSIKTLFISFFVFLFLMSLLMSFQDETRDYKEKTLSQAVTDIKSQKVKTVEVSGSKVILTYKDDTKATAMKEKEESFRETLKESGVDLTKANVKILDDQANSQFLNLLANILPSLLLVGFLVFMFRQARGA
ncbi:MAG TPA: ATP-dependent metallopeptidase FtsH/Yme1/Tma family protein, partial [Candidatus Nitrosocosmicus sp.]|nr:ATP-dependent metallopeptidase FtsH/Yme1/Tma family protein [Candidatus Nitrosocosmicus sp.]